MYPIPIRRQQKPLHAELPQMMVVVFPQKGGPLLGAQQAESRMGMRGTPLRPAFKKLVQHAERPGFFRFKIAVVVNPVLRIRGDIPGHRLIVDQRFLIG